MESRAVEGDYFIDLRPPTLPKSFNTQDSAQNIPLVQGTGQYIADCGSDLELNKNQSSPIAWIRRAGSQLYKSSYNILLQ